MKPFHVIFNKQRSTADGLTGLHRSGQRVFSVAFIKCVTTASNFRYRSLSVGSWAASALCLRKFWCSSFITLTTIPVSMFRLVFFTKKTDGDLGQEYQCYRVVQPVHQLLRDRAQLEGLGPTSSADPTMTAMTNISKVLLLRRLEKRFCRELLFMALGSLLLSGANNGKTSGVFQL